MRAKLTISTGGRDPTIRLPDLFRAPANSKGRSCRSVGWAPLPGDGPHRVDQGLGEIPPCRFLDNRFQGANHLREAGIGGEIGPAVPVGQQRASGPIEDDREINLQLAGDAFQLLNAVRTGSGPQALDVRVPGQESCGEHRSLGGILLHLPGDFAHAHGFEGLVQGRAEPLVQVSVHHGKGEEGHEDARKQGHPQEGKQELPVKARARPLALVLEVELQQVAQQNQDKGQQQDDVERSESQQKQGCLAPGIAENGREVEGLLHHREQQQHADRHRQRDESSSRFARIRCHVDSTIIGPRVAKSQGVPRRLWFLEPSAWCRGRKPMEGDAPPHHGAA